MVLPVRLISAKMSDIATGSKPELHARLYENLHFAGSFCLSNELAMESLTQARAAVVDDARNL
jgi:hypothetical protein